MKNVGVPVEAASNTAQEVVPDARLVSVLVELRPQPSYVKPEGLGVVQQILPGQPLMDSRKWRDRRRTHADWEQRQACRRLYLWWREGIHDAAIYLRRQTFDAASQPASRRRAL